MDTSTACFKCQSMLGSLDGIRALVSESGYEHHNWIGVHESSLTGCDLCKAVVKRVQDERTELVASDSTNEMRILVRLVLEPSDKSIGNIGSDNPLEGRKIRKISFNFADANVKLLFDVEASFGQLPRRVLDLGPVGEEVADDGPIQLKESYDGEKAIYATLSYCWGDPNYQYITTKANLDTHLSQLPPAHELPKTIADAIKITRHLGLQYLWIDALCIIQDDETDKLEQIEAMSDIYRNSIVTIAASCASGVSEGFLGTAKPLKANARLPLVLGTEQEPTFGVVYLRGDWISISVSDEPLYSRAWTFQEAILSPRILDYNTYNSVQICSDLEYPSLYSGGRDVGHEWPGREIFKDIHRLEATKLFQAMYWMHPRYVFRRGQFDLDTFGMWADVLYEFTARRLTVPSDRLPALAGIAKRLSPFAGTYAAGLWKESMVQHLGWEHRSMGKWPWGAFEAAPNHVDERDGSEPRPSPSWSWVSVPYGVAIAPLLEAETRLVDCRVKLVNDQSPYGRVDSAILVLEAKVIGFTDFQLTPQFLYDGTQEAFDEGETVRLDFGEPIPRRFGSIKLLYLGSRSHYDDSKSLSQLQSADARSFLILKNTEETERYRRIGILHVREENEIVRSGALDSKLASIPTSHVHLE
ncbi:hypothetical protein NM208_g8748 [Fusarium decemcellulare]|uniref:Uncharacterized protein n=1 Tax=Fusarium decemcellulare TaxID=57161 RepID=A0ACC1S4P8_9HYPO|nr:hypothetical protein NM208_g8748 [Fusarium decemcellulare]